MTKLIFVFGLAAWLALVSGQKENLLRLTAPLRPEAVKLQAPKIGTIQRNIIGGSLATSRDQFPYQGALQMDSTNLCGCSLISRRWALTAAHCAKGFNIFVMYFGITDRNAAHDSFRVIVKLRNNASVFVHEGFNPAVTALANDVAVLQFPADIALNIYVQPILLPRSTDTSTFENQTAVVSGWGLLTNGPASNPNLLHFVNVMVWPNHVCQRYYLPSLILPSTLCTHSNTLTTQGVCSGDSGGPLVATDSTGTKVQIGVVSFFPFQNCTKNIPSGYARVTSFLSWILQKTGIPNRA